MFGTKYVDPRAEGVAKIFFRNFDSIESVLNVCWTEERAWIREFANENHTKHRRVKEKVETNWPFVSLTLTRSGIRVVHQPWLGISGHKNSIPGVTIVIGLTEEGAAVNLSTILTQRVNQNNEPVPMHTNTRHCISRKLMVYLLNQNNWIFRCYDIQ